MRVTGGRFKNKKIEIPEIGDIRPTSEKMRQAVFNLLAHARWGMDLVGKNVLDGFCGSGIMGIEALSRGASYCVFIDQDHGTLKRVKAILPHLKLQNQTWNVKHADLTKHIPSLNAAIDFVFCDPPYGKNYAALFLKLLGQSQCLSDQALVIFETERAHEFLQIEPYFIIEDERAYGSSKLVILRYNAAIEKAE